MQKKLFYFLSLLIIGALTFTSCDDGDDDPMDEPETETLYEESIFTKDDQDYTIVTVDDRGEGTGTITWTNDKVYVLDGFVFVNEGQTLTIEEGTIVKGKSGEGENASALIVARGGKIEAEGTSSTPIIFTAESDQIYRNANGLSDEENLSSGVSGLWGGVIILGNSTLNASTNEKQIEGIPTDETRGLYGGDNPSDNSGTFRYVSIRHGGSNIGAGNEINGLTMGGVGTGTTIEYVEVYSNEDDGFEWFGGTVNTRYLVSAFCGDDAMDYDEGWRGNNQYWLIYQKGEGDRGGEHDGGPSDCETCEPYAIPLMANVTYSGQGVAADKRALTYRDNAGGAYYNSIFMDYGKGVDIELLDDQCSYDMFEQGNLNFRGNILFNIASGTFVVSNESTGRDEAAANASMMTYFENNSNSVTDPMLDNLAPMAGGAAASMGVDFSNEYIQSTDYRGAFAPGQELWISGWTKLSSNL